LGNIGDFNTRNIVRAHPDVRVEIGADPPKAVTANELPRDERDRVYRIITERAPMA
jgi:hypothetical protein